VAYLAMLRAARAYMLLKGLRPKDGFQHKTVIEFLDEALKDEDKQLILRFDRMRRKKTFLPMKLRLLLPEQKPNQP